MGVDVDLLDMYVVSYISIHSVWYKVVLGGWVCLHDIPTLSTNIQIPDLCVLGNAGRSFTDRKSVRSIVGKKLVDMFRHVLVSSSKVLREV